MSGLSSPRTKALNTPLSHPPGTKIYVTTAIVEGLRVWFIEPKNGFFDTGSVYGRNDDEVRSLLVLPMNSMSDAP